MSSTHTPTTYSRNKWNNEENLWGCFFVCFFLFQEDYAIPQILIYTVDFFPDESEKTRYWFCEDVWVICSVLQEGFSQELSNLYALWKAEGRVLVQAPFYF